jgi:hypothetical protein
MSNPDSPLSKLPDSQVFSRDPESLTAEDELVVLERMTRISDRLRRARELLSVDDRAALDAKLAKAEKKKAPKKPRKKKTAPDAAIETP